MLLWHLADARMPEQQNNFKKFAYENLYQGSIRDVESLTSIDAANAVSWATQLLQGGSPSLLSLEV